MNPLKTLMLVACLSGSAAVCAQTQPPVREQRGELLYSTHCVSCHTSEVHWRDKRLATDWASLKAQVRRWESNIGLGWGEDDVVAVARYLNALHYHFPVVGEGERARGNASQQLARQ